MRKAIATIGSGSHERMLERSIVTFLRYADLHGYEVCVGDGSMPRDPPRPAAWAKIPLVQSLLDSHDVVLWLDADAIILDDSVDLASLLDPAAFQGIALARTDDELIPNTGVWLLRSDERSREFLRLVWESTEFIDRRWWENAAVLHLLGHTIDYPVRLVDPSSKWLTGTQWLPQEWNQVTYFTRRLDPEARIRHYAGEPNDVRIRQMETDLHVREGRRVRARLGVVRWEFGTHCTRRLHPETRIRHYTGRPQRPLWWLYSLIRRSVRKARRIFPRVVGRGSGEFQSRSR